MDNNDHENYKIQTEQFEDGSHHRQLNNVGTITIDQAYELSYGNNFFQLFDMIFVRFSYCLTGYVTFSLPFLVKAPDFICRNTIDDDWAYWTKHEACSGKFSEYKIDYESKETLNNWITSIGLEWAPNYQIGMFGSLHFIGLFVGSAVFLRLADILGRKLFVQIGVVGSLVCIAIIYFVNNLITIYIMLFVYSIFHALRVFIGYIYVMELTPPNSKKFWHMFMQILDKTHAILIPIFIYFTGNAKYPMIFLFFTSLLCAYFIHKAPESPQYLYSNKKWDKLNKGFEYIWSRNYTKWGNYKFDSQVNLVDNDSKHKLSCIEALKDKTNLRNLLIMAFIWSTGSFCYYTLSFYAQYFKGSMYVNAAVIGVADVLSKPIIRCLQSCQQTKTTYTMVYLIVFWVSIVYYFINNITVWVVFSILLMRCGIAWNFGLSYYANQEYFHTDFTSAAFAVCNTAARLLTILAPMFAEVLSQPLIFLSCATLIASGLACFLDKSANVSLSDEPEISDKYIFSENSIEQSKNDSD